MLQDGLEGEKFLKILDVLVSKDETQMQQQGVRLEEQSWRVTFSELMDKVGCFIKPNKIGGYNHLKKMLTDAKQKIT